MVELMLESIVESELGVNGWRGMNATQTTVHKIVQHGCAAVGGRPDRTTTLAEMPEVLFFAHAREAAGTARATIDGATVREVLDAAVDRFGDGFADVLGTCTVWVNGDAAGCEDVLGPADEVAVLPPVSGGS